jgi:hypothetical protein
MVLSAKFLKLQGKLGIGKTFRAPVAPTTVVPLAAAFSPDKCSTVSIQPTLPGRDYLSTQEKV